DAGARFWDLASGREQALGSVSPTPTAAVKFHPSGRELFTNESTGLFRRSLTEEAGTLRLGPAHKLLGAGASGQISLDQKSPVLTVVGGGNDGRGLVLDLENPSNEIPSLSHVNVTFVATSPDGRWIATGTRHGPGVKVWEAQGGKLLRHLIPDEPAAKVDF